MKLLRGVIVEKHCLLALAIERKEILRFADTAQGVATDGNQKLFGFADRRGKGGRDQQRLVDGAA